MNKKNAKVEAEELTQLYNDDPFMFNVFEELEEYFNLKRKSFTVKLDEKGTEFQKRVWKELRKIPYGETFSYKKISENLGDPNLVRAVGRANGANPIPIITPCHRVINSDGKLGGYSAGLMIKEKLLELEGSLSLELFN
ncbi:MAG: methylated-DNA--[protein]-cysteine S-methyltransferase [Ignavibacteriaceae bacterium]